MQVWSCTIALPLPAGHHVNWNAVIISLLPWCHTLAMYHLAVVERRQGNRDCPFLVLPLGTGFVFSYSAVHGLFPMEICSLTRRSSAMRCQVVQCPLAARCAHNLDYPALAVVFWKRFYRHATLQLRLPGCCWRSQYSVDAANSCHACAAHSSCSCCNILVDVISSCRHADAPFGMSLVVSLECQCRKSMPYLSYLFFLFFLSV